jgi:hypothetical protein
MREDKPAILHLCSRRTDTQSLRGNECLINIRISFNETV